MEIPEFQIETFPGNKNFEIILQVFSFFKLS